MDEGLLERLEAVLDELADLDVDTLDDATVDDLVVALGAHATRLEAAWCRLIGVWDRRRLWAANGSKSPAARLARETHRRPADTARLVRRARHLAEMPHSAAAHAAGELCGAHVDLVASCQRSWRNADFAASEELLVELCRTRWFDNAVAAIDQWKLLADRDATGRGADPVTEGRHLSVAVGWGGEVVVNGALDPVGGEIFATALQRLCDQLRVDDRRHGVTRTTRQRRADALVEMATRAATAPPTGYAHGRCSP